MTSNSNNLKRLGQLEKYEVASENPDVRGWTIMGADGERLGLVNELIVDPEREKVRYLDVDLDNDLFSGEGSRHILVPVGAARLHEKDDMVLVNSLDRNRVRTYPVYDGKVISRDLERDTRDAIRGNEVYEGAMPHQKHENELKQHEEGTHSSDPMVKLKAERDIARAERDMAKAELELMRAKLDNIGVSEESDFYDNADYDDESFFGSRRSGS